MSGAVDAREIWVAKTEMGFKKTSLSPSLRPQVLYARI